MDDWHKKLRALAIKLCLAGRFDVSKVLLLTSSPRSGSTWLGNILRAIPKSSVLFEPLHLTHVPEAKEAGFTWRTFVQPGTRWPEGSAFLRRVFEGRVVNEWTCREMSFHEACRSSTMIVKSVRANRLLPWICREFHVRTPILLIRHPCAVIASQLKAENWRTSLRPECPPYLDDYPEFRSILSKTQRIEEHLAALWALDQLPPLMQEGPSPWIVVTYEELLLRLEETMSRISRECKFKIDLDAAKERARKPSSVVHDSGMSGIEGWRHQLSEKQIARIIETVHGFGIHFYNEQIEPEYDILTSGRYAQQIREEGK